MLFDHDAEIGAFLLLNLRRNDKDGKHAPKIEGYLYRKDEIKESQDFDRENPTTGKREKGKEDVTVQTDWYVMDCQGNWFNIRESKNPFLFHLPYFVEPGMCEDKAKLAYPIVKDWILNLYHGETPDNMLVNHAVYIPHEEPKDIPEDDTVARTAYYDQFRIDLELLTMSADWIQTCLNGTEEEQKDPKFDGHKNLLKKLDEFEYDIGDKK